MIHKFGPFRRVAGGTTLSTKSIESHLRFVSWRTSLSLIPPIECVFTPRFPKNLTCSTNSRCRETPPRPLTPEETQDCRTWLPSCRFLLQAEGFLSKFSSCSRLDMKVIKAVGKMTGSGFIQPPVTSTSVAEGAGLVLEGSYVTPLTQPSHRLFDCHLPCFLLEEDGGASKSKRLDLTQLLS